MGYCAYGYGDIEIQNTQDVLNIISKYESQFDMIDMNKSVDKIYINLSIDGNYNEDSIYDFLREIAPYVLNCEEFEFRGEDNCYWRFVYKGGRFYEQNGYIEYEEPGNVI